MRTVQTSNYNILEWLVPSLSLPEEFSNKTSKLPIIWHLAIALMLNLLSLAVPIMMLQVYDRIIPRQAFGTLTMLLIGVCTALIFDAALRIARAYIMGWTAASFEHVSSCAAMDRIIKSNLVEFEKTSIGTHVQNMGSLGRLREFYSGQAITALIDVPFVILFIALIAYLGGILVLAPIGIIISFILFSRYAGMRLRRALELRSNADDKKASYIISILSGIHTVKAMAMESLLMRRFEKYQKDNTKASYMVAKASGFANTLGSAFGQISLILTVSAGSILVINGNLSVGGLSACTLLAGRALQPIQRVLGTWLRMQDFKISHVKAESLFNIPIQPRSTATISKPEGRVLIRNASFSYDNNSDPILKNINMDIEPGEVIALAGSKGSGKSTLLQMLAGIIPTDSGIVRIDGINPAKRSLSQMRAHIGYLPKNGVILSGSILDNMTGFQNDDENVRKAKEIGNQLALHNVIDLLSKGYDTQLVDGPSDPIPPGIKQRITLTRVLKNHPALLLFDNADRTLDKEGYNLLFRMIGRLKGKCTIIISSYDQNLLSFADRTYKLENGDLLEMPKANASYQLNNYGSVRP